MALLADTAKKVSRTLPRELVLRLPRSMLPEFVIVGTGRCGTAYIAKLLREMGVRCGHEAVFSKRGVTASRTLQGDASWLAVPYLAHYRGVVLHQTREPMATINSFVGVHRFSQQLDPKRSISFVAKHFEITGDEVADSMRWYVDWNERCEPYALLRYQVEQVPERIGEILRTLGLTVEQARIDQALAAVPTTTNTKTRAALAFDDLPAGPLRDRLARTAERYGYEL
ncbi:hypothetical protein [Rhabdothermincola sp.]|uniref:hypothetical protein n=1 Tax=Rhabdothermincola sp. TaxID=2820405 RepID=UPI002FE25401